MHTIRLESGIELRAHHTIANKDDSDAVPVLLHGVGMSSRTFRPVQERLAQSGAVVSFDLPGFGATRKPDRVLSVEEVATAVDRALDELDIGHRVLVGHSMGAQFAVELARRNPELVDAVVLIGPVVDPARGSVPRQFADLVRDLLREPLDVIALALSDIHRCGLHWYLASLKQMFEYDTVENANSLQKHVLIIRGARDPIASESWCRRLASAVAGRARVRTIGRRAHMVPYSAPEAVAHAIAEVAGNRTTCTSTENTTVPATRMIQRGWWWILDYAYAGFWQVRGWLDPRRASRFRSGLLAPVVIVPGVYEHWHFLYPLVVAIHDAGHPVHVVTALGTNRRPIADGAATVARYVRDHGLRDVIIVAHSKGGLIGKLAMVDDEAGHIDRMIAICSPFAGSRYARYLPIPSIRAFTPTEKTLVRLALSTSVNERITSIFGVFDPHIPEGSELHGARNVQLPVAGHFRILAAAPTVAAVLDELAEAERPR